MSSKATPKSLPSTLLPKLIAFDLDGTIWSPEMYELWGGGSPFSIVNPTSTVKDCSGRKVNLLGESSNILHWCYENRESVVTAYVSTCDEPEWANECLNLFTTTGNVLLKDVSHSSLIYKENKQHHFRALKKQFDLEFGDMIFFDNQMNNIRDVQKLGVFCVYCPDGMVESIWSKGFADYEKQKK